MTNNLPQGWVECEFEDICNIYTGNSINKKEKSEKYTGLTEGYNYIATKDISSEQEINYENGVKIPFEKQKFRIAPKNTTLLCIEGGSAGRKIGFTNEDVCFVNKLCAFVPYSNNTNSKYIYYYLQSKKYTNRFNLNKSGLIGGVSISKLKTINIDLAPLNEQKRIVEKIEEEFLKIDEGIEKLKLAQEQIVQYKQSVLKSAFEGKLYKTSEWEEKQLKDITKKISDGSHNPPPKQPRGIPMLSGRNIKNGKINFDEFRYITKEAFDIEFKRAPIEANDVLLTIVGTIGETAVVPNNAQLFTIQRSVALLKPLIDSFYLKYYLDSPVAFLYYKKNEKGTAQKGIYLETLKNMPIIFPEDKNEQVKIVKEIEKRFEVADKAEKVIMDSLEKAQQLKQSILKKAFEGRLVPQDPKDEPASVLLEKIKTERGKNV